jgi:hypothetical protein
VLPAAEDPGPQPVAPIALPRVGLEGSHEAPASGPAGALVNATPNRPRTMAQATRAAKTVDVGPSTPAEPPAARPPRARRARSRAVQAPGRRRPPAAQGATAGSPAASVVADDDLWGRRH